MSIFNLSQHPSQSQPISSESDYLLPSNQIDPVIENLFNIQIHPLLKTARSSSPLSSCRVQLLPEFLDSSPDGVADLDSPLPSGIDLLEADFQARTSRSSSSTENDLSQESILRYFMDFEDLSTSSTTQQPEDSGDLQPQEILAENSSPLLASHPDSSIFSQPSKKRKAAELPEEQRRRRRNELLKRKRAEESPEERAVRLAKARERIAQVRANETEQQKAARMKKDKEKIANETPEERAARLAKRRAYEATLRAKETPEKKAARLAKRRMNAAALSPAEKAAISAKKKVYYTTRKTAAFRGFN